LLPKNGTPKSLKECIDNIIDEMRQCKPSLLDEAFDKSLLSSLLEGHICEYFNNRFQSIQLLLTHRLSDDDENVLINEFRRIYDGPVLPKNYNNNGPKP
jgi:hypothetical protein